MGNKDFKRLRELAKQVREITELPIQKEKIKLWTAVNDRKMIRPTVLIRDYPIYMLQYNDELVPTIEDEFLRKLENDLLLRIYEWRHMQVDRVIDPVVKCPVVVEDTGYGIEASTKDVGDFMYGEEYKTAKRFIRQISTEEDLDKIKMPVVTYDKETTMKNFNLMQEIFDGILEVQLSGISFFHCVLWDDLLSWMGIQEGMYDFILNPEFMHKAADRYMKACISRAKQYESLGLVSSNNGNVLVGQGGLGYTSDLPAPTKSGIGGRLCDNWGDGADQIFTSVSPGMTREFAIDHEVEWANLFGLMYYGCCDRLDHKISELKAFKNLRKVSMSPYAHLEAGMEELGSEFVVSFKPNSNYLAAPTWDRELSRKELIKVCELARKYNSNVEIIMKTLISVQGEPQRLWEWCDMAMEIVENY